MQRFLSSRVALIGGVLTVITLLTYLPSLRNGFVDIDDGLLITQNALVLHVNPRTLWGSFSTYDPELYIPLTFLSYQLQAAVFGIRPFWFHLGNLLLHMGTALLVFAVTRRLAAFRLDEREAVVTGVVCAFLFALHPLNTEAVAWAAARKDVLSGFLFFAALLQYLRYRASGARSVFVWSVFLFLLALLAKVSVLLFPLVLLLADAAEGRRFTRGVWMEKLPYAALSVLFGVIALFGKQEQVAALSLVQKFLLACKATAFYLSSFVWPSQLAIFHPQAMPMRLSSSDLWFPPFIVLLLVAAAVWAYRRKRLVFFGIGFFLVSLLPSFITFWKNGFVYFASERYAYIPMVGIIFAAGALIVPWLLAGLNKGGTPARLLGIGVSALFLFVLSGLSLRQSLTWRDAITLNERVLALTPSSAHALNNAGSAYFAAGRKEEALRAFEQAIAIDPALPAAYANKGQALRALGRREEALQVFAEGIAAIPKDRSALPQDLTPYLRFSELLDEMGKSQEAAQALRGAIAHYPQAPLPHYYLGLKEQQFGHRPEAREQFRIATELDPTLADAFYRYAAVSAEIGELREAARALDRVLVLDPQNAVAAEHLKNIKALLER